MHSNIGATIPFPVIDRWKKRILLTPKCMCFVQTGVQSPDRLWYCLCKATPVLRQLRQHKTYLKVVHSGLETERPETWRPPQRCLQYVMLCQPVRLMQEGLHAHIVLQLGFSLWKSSDPLRQVSLTYHQCAKRRLNYFNRVIRRCNKSQW